MHYLYRTKDWCVFLLNEEHTRTVNKKKNVLVYLTGPNYKLSDDLISYLFNISNLPVVNVKSLQTSSVKQISLILQ